MYITGFLLDFYRELGLDPHWAKDDPDITLSHDPFCQSGYEAYDIIIQGHKIGGNAQKRTKKAIFQHGSVPLRRNAQGISLEDMGIKLDEREARECLIAAFDSAPLWETEGKVHCSSGTSETIQEKI